MIKESFICFDTETTDLVGNLLLPLDKQPHIIEFAAVVMRQIDSGSEWYEEKHMDVLIKPPVDMTDQIQKITNIDRTQLLLAEPFNYYQQEISDFFRGVKYRVGHNIRFDEAMLDFEYARLGYGPVWRYERQKSRCTVEMNEHVFGRRANLAEVYEKYIGEPLTGAHRALTDVRATVKVALEMIKQGIL